MLSFDGQGYGRSEYWEMMSSYAIEFKHEKCSCWDKGKPHFQLKSDPSMHKSIRIEIVCKSLGCNAKFEESSKYMLKKFHQFYWPTDS